MKIRKCIAAAVLLLFAGFAAAAVFLKSPAASPVQGGFTLDENAQNYTPSGGLSSGKKSGIAVPGYSTVYFPADETDVPLTLYNPEKNTCLFRFELYLDDEDTPAACTGLIEPGKAVQRVTLTRPLCAGSYALHIKVNAFAADTHTPLNNALVEAELCVLPA